MLKCGAKAASVKWRVGMAMLKSGIATAFDRDCAKQHLIDGGIVKSLAHFGKLCQWKMNLRCYMQ